MRPLLSTWMFLLSSLPLAWAGPPPSCDESLLSLEQAKAITETAVAVSADRSLQDSIRAASEALGEAFVQKMNEAAEEDAVSDRPRHTVEELARDMGPLLRSSLIQDAIARTLRKYGLRKASGVSTALENLRTASAMDQISFTEYVIRQMDNSIEQAMILADEDRIDELEKLWGMDLPGLLEMIQRWQLLQASAGSEIRLALLGWLRLVEPGSFVSKVREFSKKDVGGITNFERIRAKRLLVPHSLKDLAQNKGPISDAQFGRRFKILKIQAALVRTAITIRYPNKGIAVLALSILPVSVTHAMVADWNLTNTLATLIGGVATCPSLIDMLSRPARVADGRAAERFRWIDLLTLKQLNELREYMRKNPKSAAEIRLDELATEMDQRITQLRAIRYGR